MLGALNRVGCEGEMTGHGFRCLASTILNEKVYERAHIEMQLAHVPNKEVEVAYNNALFGATSRHDARLGGLRGSNPRVG